MVAAKLCLVLVTCLSGSLPTPDDAVEAAILKVLELKSTPAALRAFVTTKTPVAVPDQRLALLVRDLGVEDFKVREAAQAELVRGGPAVVDRLRAAAQATKHPGQIDLIKGSIIRITKEWSPRDVAAYRAAVRAIARRPDESAVPCLLGALPTLAEDDEMVAAAWRALDAVAVRTRAVPEACAAARTDRQPERRAVAAFLLGRHGAEGQRKQAAEMLNDPAPVVRLRAAQGLLGTGDLAGVPALVALLDAKPVPLAWEAEELLVWLAGAGAPAERVGDGREATKARAAWERWQKTAKPDWKKATEAPGRPLLLLVRDDDPVGFHRPTVVVGSDGRVRWTAPSPAGQDLIVDRVTSEGRVLGAVRPKERPHDTHPRFVDMPLGGELRSGAKLSFAFSSHEKVLVRRWLAGWTLIAGAEGFRFVLRGEDELVHLGTLPRFKNRPDDPGEQMSGSPTGTHTGALWYWCPIPSERNVFGPIFLEPGTGSCPQAHTFAAAANPTHTQGVRLVRGSGTVFASGNRLREMHGPRCVWDVQVAIGFKPTVSFVCPLIRFGFNDLVVPRSAAVPSQ